MEIRFPRRRQQRSCLPTSFRTGWCRVGVSRALRLRGPSERLYSTGCQSSAGRGQTAAITMLWVHVTSALFQTSRLAAGRTLAAGRCGAATSSLINDAGDASSSLANTDTGRGDGPVNPAAPRVSLSKAPPPPSDTSSRLSPASARLKRGAGEMGGRG